MNLNLTKVNSKKIVLIHWWISLKLNRIFTNAWRCEISMASLIDLNAKSTAILQCLQSWTLLCNPVHSCTMLCTPMIHSLLHTFSGHFIWAGKGRAIHVLHRSFMLYYRHCANMAKLPILCSLAFLLLSSLSRFMRNSRIRQFKLSDYSSKSFKNVSA